MKYTSNLSVKDTFQEMTANDARGEWRMNHVTGNVKYSKQKSSVDWTPENSIHGINIENKNN